MTELQELMRQSVAELPHDDADLHDLVVAGRRRVGTRRLRLAGAAGSATLAAAVVAAVLVPRVSGEAGPAAAPPAPDAPTVHLSDATPGVEGRDFRVLASHTNQNLDRDNGQYFDGVTDDGKILFRDGPRADDWTPHRALMDPVTGAKDRLPDLRIGQDDTMPVELGAHRLVLVSQVGVGRTGSLIAHVFDRDTRRWSTVRWPALPAVAGPSGVLGPDGRLYVPVLAAQGAIPEGGWPLGRNKEADDSGAEGDTYHLWSVSLADPSDVRDEHLSVGSVAFTPTSMVWSDRTNGAGGLIHVRSLATGEEHTFDPHSGARCNLLSLSASEDRVVLSEYCGDYAGGVRDDRVQVLSTNGDQVATIQGSGIGGLVATIGGDNAVVTLNSSERDAPGTYVYDLRTDRLLRITHQTSRFAMGGPAPAGDFLWTTPVNHGEGATQWLGRLLP